MMLTGTHPLLGRGVREDAVAMRYEENSGGIWTWLIRTRDRDPIRYRYFIKEENEEITVEEWGEYRSFDPSQGSSGQTGSARQ